MPAMTRPRLRVARVCIAAAYGTGPRRDGRPIVVTRSSSPARSATAARRVRPSSHGLGKVKWSFAETAANPRSRAASTTAARRSMLSGATPKSSWGRWVPTSTAPGSHGSATNGSPPSGPGGVLRSQVADDAAVRE